MSRDFTPIELYLVNEDRKKRGLESFENVKIEYVTPNGEKYPLETDEFTQYKKQYKNLGLLYVDGMKKLVNKYGIKNDTLNNTFQNIEKDLTDVISCIGSKNSDKQLNKTVEKWFLGELDEAFYYSNQNNQLFGDYIENQMREKDIGNKKRLFIDMDGVLAKFTYVTHEDKLFQKNYFKNLVPQAPFLLALKNFINHNPNVECYILSAYLSDSQYALKEKQEWCNKWIPEINAEHRIFMPCGKNKADYIPYKINEKDFLIDDYSKNLINWDNNNGIGIKLLNGINNRPKGEYFDRSEAKSDNKWMKVTDCKGISNNSVSIKHIEDMLTSLVVEGKTQTPEEFNKELELSHCFSDKKYMFVDGEKEFAFLKNSLSNEIKEKNLFKGDNNVFFKKVEEQINSFDLPKENFEGEPITKIDYNYLIIGMYKAISKELNNFSVNNKGYDQIQE